MLSDELSGPLDHCCLEAARTAPSHRCYLTGPHPILQVGKPRLPGIGGGEARSRSRGVGYSLAASIMLAQKWGCLCRGSSSGPLSL